MNKFDVSKITVYDLDGNKKEEYNVGKLLGDLIYERTSTIDWLDKAKTIHSGKELELSDNDLNQLLTVLVHPAANLSLIVKDAILKYIKVITTPAEEVPAD